ncbi:fluoride efflux transporter CrcB [Neobacillus cucumis]|uniref:fluoride efflux transporter CrcB n=1 Tax=Neobacillus cucumis TaxID=1740721 RepID=UPI0018DF8E6C|nr:fluoride efflux transporter CrcB [Neobacillus cucumis]MBI0575945.1 fluoride efflux transporter CrcB [Neobacillus cucumis]
MVYLFVGMGGIIGSLLRYGLSLLAVNIWGERFPIGTLLINLTGAFLLGWFTSRFGQSKKLHPYFITAFSTGVVGSYTTFSTFCLETVRLMEAEAYIKGLIYVLFSLFGGLLFVKMGQNFGNETGKAK